MEIKQRSRNIFDNLDNKPDAIVIENYCEPYIDDNFFYITGLEKGIFEGCAAVLFPDGNIDLLVSELEAESAKKSSANLKIYGGQNSYNNALKDSLSHVKSIGLNFDRVLYRKFQDLKKMFPDVEFVDVSVGFVKTRLVKDKIEIETTRKACEIADKAMEKIPDILHEGMFEFELAAEIDYLMQKNGADKSAFDTISSFGKNTAEPHYTHGTTKLSKGDFVLCDFGACYKKYNSDMTRVFVFGKASEKQKAMHKTVLDAQRIGFDRIKPGLKAQEVHNSVSTYIDNTEFKGRFIHSTGHSIGLSVHDGGAGFSQTCEIKVEENMLFTVEPGVYIPGFGGVRIEDDILVKKDGIEILTKSPRDLIEIL